MKFAILFLFIAFQISIVPYAQAIVGGANVGPHDLLARSVVALQMEDPITDGSTHFYHGSAVLISGSKVVLYGIASHHRYERSGLPLAECAFTSVPPLADWINKNQIYQR